MSPVRIAYMPLITYPDSQPDESVESGVALATAIGCELHATTFSVDIPRVSAPIGGMLINIPGMVRTIEEASHVRCRHLQAFLSEKAGAHTKVHFSMRESQLGSTGDAAAYEARYFDLALLPWSKESPVVSDFAQTVVFGAGRPSILIPAGVTSAPVKHVAIAWDASRVAARALADLMPLLPEDCRITVLTVQDEKPLPRNNIAESLAASLQQRGYHAVAHVATLGRRRIGAALQEAALNAGAQILAMGGFGHSRVRDFVLGGATKDVFADLSLPVLLSH